MLFSDWRRRRDDENDEIKSTIREKNYFKNGKGDEDKRKNTVPADRN